MVDSAQRKPKILILATLSGGYAGADAVGQLHRSYATNTYILPVLCPCLFPESFYLRAFERGIDAILVMYSGTDSPYIGGPGARGRVDQSDLSAYERARD